MGKGGGAGPEAGFDGVEINGGTCHQINTFFSRIWNKRDDEYGCASLENRARFMCDIIREVKKRVRPGLCGHRACQCRGVRVCIGDHHRGRGGLARLLEAAGADAIQVRGHAYGSRGGLLQPDRLYYPAPSDSLPKGLDWSRQGAGAIVPLSEVVKEGGLGARLLRGPARPRARRAISAGEARWILSA